MLGREQRQNVGHSNDPAFSKLEQEQRASSGQPPVTELQKQSVAHLDDPSLSKSEQEVNMPTKKDHHSNGEMHSKMSHKVALHGDSTIFHQYEECAALDEKAEYLPDIVHIPFEDAVAEDVLQGWEDEWIASGEFDVKRWGKLEEPKIDFVYTWVNGSDEAFQETIYPYELNSTLNDAEGRWLKTHRTNRYRDWDELRYSIRSIEKHAGSFMNRVQILVNSVRDGKTVWKQTPTWLDRERMDGNTFQVLSQEDFFQADKQSCLPTFNSLTIENQIFNTKSDIDRIFALSDDMVLGRHHTASDIYSPLFGPAMGFKTNSYSTTTPPTDVDAKRFGEKPYLIYTSWLLNRRFGVRKRKGQAHFGHSISRRVTREAMASFPRPELRSACQRFRGESGFQLYSWYVAFQYTIERHREAMLWSYIMLRSDTNNDENLSWHERQVIMAELEDGMMREGKNSFRARNYYHVAQELGKAGLEPPKVNTDILWTSLDGPAAIRDTECVEFNVDECLAPGFSVPSSDDQHRNPVFSTATIFDRVSRQEPKCGDCLIKLLLNRVRKGLSPVLPHKDTQVAKRHTVTKALMRYQYTITNPDALFVMVTDAEQVENVLLNNYVHGSRQVPGQLCLNDDVATENKEQLQDLRDTMRQLFEGLFPQRSRFELAT
ncbi:hypothetical protein LTR04_006625 [Oleoguttula sp. CCFEE 6159]|nr:hypothetical protein LTR04_006625 [Oleoguttula sp. CCFEE 6159]